jgi:hypothetical protein
VAEIVQAHPVLGQVRWDLKLAQWEATVDLSPGQPVDFYLATRTLDLKSYSPVDLLDTGAEYLEWVRQVEPQVREFIADELLDLYNDNWRKAERDGCPQGLPELTRTEFMRRIVPDLIELDPEGFSSWYYKSGDLFLDHSITVAITASKEFRYATI